MNQTRRTRELTRRAERLSQLGLDIELESRAVPGHPQHHHLRIEGIEGPWLTTVEMETFLDGAQIMAHAIGQQARHAPVLAGLGATPPPLP